MVNGLIQTYICKRLALKISLVLTISISLFLVIFGILWSPGLIRSGWSEYQIFLDLVYKIPWFLSNTYPAIIGVGTMMTFSAFAQNNELVVLQAVGFSKIDFIKTILVPGIVFALFGFFLVACLSPLGYKLVGKIKMNPAVIQSAWLREKNNIIYIKKLMTNNAYGIEIFKLGGTRIKKFYLAREATLGNSSQLYSVLTKRYQKDGVTQRFNQTLAWRDTLPKANSLLLLSMPEKQLTLFELYHLIKIQKRMGLALKSDQFRFFRMILLPFFTLILMFMLLPFAFKENRSKSLTKNIMIGLAIGLLFFYFNQIAFPLVVLLKLPIFFGAMLAPIFISIFCLIYSRFN